MAWRRVGSETIVIHLARKMMFGLNPAGGRVWEALDGPATFEELVRLVPVEACNGPTAKAALAAFLADLAAEDLVIVEPGLPETGDREAHPHPESTSLPSVTWREEVRRFAGACAFYPGVSVICDQQPFSS